MSILCVGREPIVLQLLVKIFQRLGFPDVTILGSVEEAWQALEEGNYELLVITSVLMPGMERGELIYRVRSHPTKNRLPILLISGYELNRAAEVPNYFFRVNSYLPKPFSIVELEEAIKMAFYNKSCALNVKDIYYVVKRSYWNVPEEVKDRFTQKWSEPL
jgi:CheY-like chemotaxis protein